MTWLLLVLVGVVLTLVVPHFGAMILAGGFLLWLLAVLAHTEDG